MAGIPIPDHEDARVRDLRSYRVLDTDPEQAYDDIVALASYLVGAPASMISLLDSDRQWFKARKGVEHEQTPRKRSFCAHLVGRSKEPMVVEDTTQDPRYKENPMVLGDPGIRFYAGFPLVSPEGHVLGSLCVIDTEPRSLAEEEEQMLRALSRQVMTLLNQRRRIEHLEDRMGASQAGSVLSGDSG